MPKHFVRFSLFGIFMETRNVNLRIGKNHMGNELAMWDPCGVNVGLMLAPCRVDKGSM